MKTVLELLGAAVDRVPIRWSGARYEALQRQASGEAPSATPVGPPLAGALLKCADGFFREAEREVLDLLRANFAACQQDNESFISFAEALFTVQRFDLLAALLRQKHGYAVEFELTVSADTGDPYCCRWDVLPWGAHRFTFDATAYEDDDTKVKILAFNWIFPLWERYSRQPDPQQGSVFINLGDIGYTPGLAFCDSRPDRFLIPDPVFVPTRGYADDRRAFDNAAIAWEDRRSLAFWRGSTTGMQRPLGDWRSLERVQLCELARQNPELIDAGISRVVQFDEPAVVHEIEAAGLMRDFVRCHKWVEYKYQIDIDGNTNAWAGLFYRLLSGSTVLKVSSERGFEQWYYDRLVPWQHYVPVAPDLSDLVDKIQWLQRNDAAARQIGEQGRALADSLTYAGETARAMSVISAAFRYAGGSHAGIGPFGRSARNDAGAAPASVAPAAEPAAVFALPAEPASAAASPAPAPQAVTVDAPDAAVARCLTAAAQGDPEAQFQLAAMLCTGQGVAQDLPEAASWYERAAKQGHRIAQYNLAVLLLQGQGIPQDPGASFQWASKAAKQGVVEAQNLVRYFQTLAQQQSSRRP